jgi:hypothetical protein
LLDQTTPTPLVKTALQRLVSVEPEEEKISTRLSTRGSWRHSCAVPIVYYMLEARKEARGRFRTNQRVAKVMGRGSHEIGLIAEDVRLVIEIDGEQHRTLTRPGAPLQ